MTGPQPRRLPGVRFEVPPPALDETLPRMDIAFFLGFATRGPLGRAVAVESLAQFEAQYGTAIALARDPATGATLTGLLHPGVRSFFGQGGRRCWILRVAGAGAVTRSFGVPGLLQAARPGSGRPWRLERAVLRAASPGSGADTLRLSVAPDTRWLRVRPLQADAGMLALSVAAGALADLGAGDLLRVSRDGVQLHGRIERIAVRGGQASVTLRALLALRTLSEASPGPLPLAAELAGEAAGSPPLAVEGQWVGSGLLRLRCRLAAPPQPGAVVRLLLVDGGEAWMALRSVAIEQAAEPGVLPQFALDGQPWEVVDGQPEAAAWATGGEERLAQRLRVVLRAREGAGEAVVSAPLVLGCGAGESLGLFGLDEASGFPLVSPSSPDERVALPLADLDTLTEGLGPDPDDRPALERDGLADFSWGLFADPALAGYGADVLADRAEALRHAGRTPRDLQGMHALFGGAAEALLDEPTLLAIPDAVHPGWRSVIPPPAWAELPPPTASPPEQGDTPFLACDAEPLPAPRFVRGADPDAGGDCTLYWTEVAEGASYRLEEDADAAFGAATVLYEGEATRWALLARAAGSYCYRVRATLGARRSDWSPPVRVTVGSQAYETQAWHSGPLLAIQRLMLRAAAARGDVLAVLSLPAHFDAAAAAAHADALRDTSPVLDAGLPPAIGVDEARALSHGALYHPWPVVRTAGDSALLRFPPDGAACGQLANTALQRGAWIAGANQPLRDVVALTPADVAPGLAQRQRVLDAQVNLLRSVPQGFVISTADTLTGDSAWRPLNVRRLMCLLRRLALKRGADYVFEPNGPTLRRTVERGFEAVLDLLFRQGALAGARASDAYRVDAGEESNPTGRSDLGQFRVELKVAPALPLSFLTVRLAREGERIVSQELH